MCACHELDVEHVSSPSPSSAGDNSETLRFALAPTFSEGESTRGGVHGAD